MSTTPARTKCKATTKKGTRCTRVPWRDLDVCLAHAPSTVRESRGFIARNGKAGRTPVKTATQLHRAIAEKAALVLIEPHFAALGYRVIFDAAGEPILERLPEGGAMLHGTSQRDGEINMSQYPDLGARQAAAERILDRALGRPKQSVAVGGADGGAIMLRVGQMLDSSSASLAGELAARLAIEAANEEAG